MRLPENGLAANPDRRSARPIAAVVAICSLAYLLDGVVHTVMGPLAPSIARALGLSNAQLGPVFSANLIGQFFGLILFPLVAGRLGHRGVIVSTLFGFGLFQTLSSLAQDGQQLFWLRLATGFFLGGALPSCLAVVTGVTPVQRRGLIITTLFVAYGIGAALAGLVTLLLPIGGWRGATALIGACCLLAGGIAWAGLKNSQIASSDGGQGDAPRSAQIVCSLVTPPYLIGTLMLWVLFISMLTISYCLTSWLPILLVQTGHDPWLASISVAIFGLGGIFAGLVVGLLIDRFGATRVLVGFMLAATLLLLWIAAVLKSASTVVLLALLVVCGFFALGAYAGINVVLATYYPHHLRALGIGLTKSIGRVGTVIAPVLVGLALSAGVREAVVMALFAIPTAVSALALLVIAAARGDRE